jgi:regulator of sigma E protease
MQGAFAVILVLGALIFFHELGHFLVARLLRIGVKTFSLGFGPRLLAFDRGRTRYQLSLVPLGGYVQLVGESAEDDQPDGFTAAENFSLRPPLHRMLVVAAGPVFNFVLAWVVLFGIYATAGKTEMATTVGSVQAESAAEAAGILPGDRIVALDGAPVHFWNDMTERIGASQGRPMEVTVERDGATLVMEVTPRLAQRRSIFGETITTPMLGVGSAGELATLPMHAGSALIEGARDTWGYIVLTFNALVKIVERVIPLETVGGPIMIAQLVSQGAEQGIVSVLLLTAIISVNLGLINLFPIPVLDGGHILFFALEMVFRRPVPERWQVMTTRLGIVFLVALMGLAIFNDILRLFTAPS